VVNGHSFILICQMAALVRRAFTEVCTVSVLLVIVVAIVVVDVVIVLPTLYRVPYLPHESGVDQQFTLTTKKSLHITFKGKPSN